MFWIRPLSLSVLSLLCSLVVVVVVVVVCVCMCVVGE
jgi:hypothetical protein